MFSWMYDQLVDILTLLTPRSSPPFCTVTRVAHEFGHAGPAVETGTGNVAGFEAVVDGWNANYNHILVDEFDFRCLKYIL